MIPFHIDFKPGIPFYEQLTYAFKKAVICGVLRPGDKIPSIRALSQELRINPNTVQKAITKLVNEKVLEVQPGVGCTVVATREVNQEQRKDLITWDLEHLVVEAKRLRLSEKDIINAIQKHWKRLSREGGNE